VEEAKAASAARHVQARVRRCLVVDDSRMIRKVARRIVEDLGFEAAEAENGEEALARCKAAMPDLILLDWNMPVMSGIEFVTRLRALPADRSPRVVFCTSNSDAADIHQGIDAGADEYVIKPFDEATLRAKLRNIGLG
jgi:two-component system, chemotaxis family, chemotaxis protein CheY